MEAHKFNDAQDLHAIREQFYRDGVAFFENCDEESLIGISKTLRETVRPRNETASGTGISNIRFAPGLEGKGYSSEA
jgi:hypothetical protein